MRRSWRRRIGIRVPHRRRRRVHQGAVRTDLRRREELLLLMRVAVVVVRVGIRRFVREGERSSVVGFAGGIAALPIVRPPCGRWINGSFILCISVHAVVRLACFPLALVPLRSSRVRRPPDLQPRESVEPALLLPAASLGRLVL